MIPRSLSVSLSVATAVGLFSLSYVALAQKAASGPAAGKVAPASFRVAKLDPRKAYTGFTKGVALNNRFNSLQTELRAAQQGGNNDKAGKLTHELEVMQKGIQALMLDSLHEIVKEKKIDLVLNVRPGPGSTSEVNVLYKEPDVAVPDITPEVVDRINALAATRPALDSQPASEPAAAPPTIKLNPRPKVHIEAPKPAK